MILVTRTRVDGTPLAWVDTVARVFHNEISGVDMPRPLTDAEEAALDDLGVETGQVTAEQVIRTDLANGIAMIVAARDAAEADIPVAQGLVAAAEDVKSAAVAQHDAVSAFVPAATYQQAQLNAVKGAILAILVRQGQIIDALKGGFVYRVAVDENAVTTDNALIGLARIMSGQLDD